MDDNVIPFPRMESNKFRLTDIKDVESRMVLLRHHHINETLANVIPNLFLQLDTAGFDFTDPEDDEGNGQYTKDGAFLIEAIRSMLCKHHGIGHPFNDLADKVFAAVENEPGVLKVVDKLDIMLNNVEESGIY